MTDIELIKSLKTLDTTKDIPVIVSTVKHIGSEDLREEGISIGSLI